MHEFNVNVNVKIDDQYRVKYHVEMIDQTCEVSLRDVCLLLAGSISMLIKSRSEDDDKDYTIFKDVIDLLNEDFIDTESFKDAGKAKSIQKKPKKDDETDDT